MIMVSIILNRFLILFLLQYLPNYHSWLCLFIKKRFLFIYSLLILKFTFQKKFFSFNKLNILLIPLSFYLLILISLVNINNKLKTNLKQKCFILVTLFSILAFSTSDFLLFLIFFEASIIPLFILIIVRGKKKKRLLAGSYLIGYTFLRSVPLIITLIYLKYQIKSWYICLIKIRDKKNLFFFVSLAFLIKLPVYGFHTWLPKAHVEAPLPGSMLLAAISLKVGGYGLYFFNSLKKGKPGLIFYCFLGVLISSFICFRQTDLKVFIASVVHMSLVATSLIIKTQFSILGASLLMISHGLTSSCMFFLAKTIYIRTSSRKLIILKSIIKLVSFFSLWWLILILFDLGFPPTLKFFREIFMFLTILKYKIIYFFFIPFFFITVIFYFIKIFTKLIKFTIKKNKNFFKSIFKLEHLSVLYHIIPLFFLITLRKW